MTFPRHSLPIAARRLITSLLFAAAALTLAADASASDALGWTGTKDRLEVAVDVADPQAQRFPLIDRIDRALMAYHFRLEAVDSQGRPIPIPSSVLISLRVGSSERGNRLLLSALDQDLVIPRPWALRLRPQDSLFILVQSGGGATDEISLHLSIDYEPAERDRSRLAVTSATADRRGARADDVGLWEWTQPGDGRLIAITGLPLVRLREISLIEVESGRVVWSADLGGEIVIARTSAGSPALRFGVTVTAGHTYRLVARCSCAVAGGAPSEQVVAMVLPSQVP